MAKRNKKRNLKDTSEQIVDIGVLIESVQSESAEELTEDLEQYAKATHVEIDENQIDIETQIAEEEGKPSFKDPNSRIKLMGNSELITNHNLTHALKQYLIDDNICSVDDFN